MKEKSSVFSHSVICASLVAIAVLMQASAAKADYVSFDSLTNVTSLSIASAPRSFTGQAFNMSSSAAGATSVVTGLDTVLVSTAAVTYTNIRLNVVFWQTYNAASTTDVFSNPVNNTIYSFDLGGGTLAANAAYNITGLTFNTPVNLGGYTNVGITFNWQGDTGSGLVSNDNLSTAVRGGATAPAIAVGSIAQGAAPTYGYYRNASGKTDYNFLASDGRQVGNNSALAFRLTNATTTVVPETNTLALLGAGLAPIAGVVIARRRKKA